MSVSMYHSRHRSVNRRINCSHRRVSSTTKKVKTRNDKTLMNTISLSVTSLTDPQRKERRELEEEDPGDESSHTRDSRNQSMPLRSKTC